MRITGLGRVLFALSFTVTRILTIVTRDFGLPWRPLSEANPWHESLAMVSLFTLLVWVPTVSTHFANRFDWSEICVFTAIAGAAWAVAKSFRGKSWRMT
jgi:hypothetical protein